MESYEKQNELSEDEEEYILLDLDSVSGRIDIPAGASYMFSGLDSLNPILFIGGNVKLVGEYEDTLGTCLVFSESNCEAPAVMHPEIGPSETNLLTETCIIDDKVEGLIKQVQPMARLQKILKFRLAEEEDGDQKTADGSRETTDSKP